MGIRTVTASSRIRGGIRRNRAWHSIADFGHFPGFMKAVNRVDVLSRTERTGRSQWFVMLDGAPLRWIEKDLFDLDRGEIAFQSIDGDFEILNGAWKISNAARDGIDVSLNLNFDLGIPVLEAALGDELRNRMQGFAEAMLREIGEEIRSHECEQRKCPRYSINSIGEISLADRTLEVFFHDISERGMMVSHFDAETDGPVEMCFAGVHAVGNVWGGNGEPGLIRILFREALGPQMLERIRAALMPGNGTVHEWLSVGQKRAMAA